MCRKIYIQVDFLGYLCKCKNTTFRIKSVVTTKKNRYILIVFSNIFLKVALKMNTKCMFFTVVKKFQGILKEINNCKKKRQDSI